MPAVTSIKQQKNKNRVNVYLDDKFGFGIDLDNFVLLNLKVGRELNDKEVFEIVKKAEFQKILDKLLKFATLRPRSRKEVDAWFRRKKVHETLFEGLLKKLEKLELLDDEKFAKWWVDQRNSFRPKPKRVLKNELAIKGIGREIIESVLKENNIDEEKMAKDLIERRMYKWRNLNPREAEQKMTQYLGQKGFNWDAIEKVVQKIVK